MMRLQIPYDFNVKSLIVKHLKPSEALENAKHAVQLTPFPRQGSVVWQKGLQKHTHTSLFITNSTSFPRFLYSPVLT